MKPSKRIKGLAEKITKKHTQQTTLNEALEKCKQQLSAYSKRLRRYKKSNKRKEDNKRFHTKQKKNPIATWKAQIKPYRTHRTEKRWKHSEREFG